MEKEKVLSPMMPSPSPRKIGLLTSVFLVVAITIGNGIYTSLGIQLMTLSSGFSILALWGLAGLVVLCGALSYAELASQLPHSGGEYYYLTKIYHPAIGTMAGVITFLAGFIAPISLASMAFGKYLQVFFPSISPLWSSIILVTLVTGAHLINLRVSTIFQDSVTGLKFFLIALLLFLGFRYAKISPALFIPSSLAWKELIHPHSGVVLIFCFYAYSGWNSTAYIADEISSRRTVGRSLILGSLLVVLIYLLLNVVFLMAVPVSELRGVLDVGTVVVTHLIGNEGGQIMAILIAVGLVAGVSGMTWVGPSILQVMGKDFPSLSWLAPLSQGEIPVHALLLQYVLVIIVLATSSFKTLLVSTQIPIILCLLLGVMGTVVLRFRKSKAIADHDRAVDSQLPIFRCPLYPLPPLLFILISCLALGYTVMTNLLEGAIGLAIILVALGTYPLLRRE